MTRDEMLKLAIDDMAAALGETSAPYTLARMQQLRKMSRERIAALTRPLGQADMIFTVMCNKGVLGEDARTITS